MYCEYCGKEIGEAKFCRYCGKKVTPPPKIEPWKQSIPFSILGIVCSACTNLYFQMRGLDGALLLVFWTMLAVIWFAIALPNSLETHKANLCLAQRERRDYTPKTRWASFLNCLFGGLFGLLLNREFKRASLGVARKVLIGLSVASVLFTFILGFSKGFLYVAPFEHFVFRTTATMQREVNDEGTTYYDTSRGTTEIIIFEPAEGEIGFGPDQMGDWYEDVGWIPTDDISYSGDVSTGAGGYAVVASFADESGYYDAIVVAHVEGTLNRVYEIRLFFQAGDVSSWRQTTADVLGDFQPFD